MTGLVVVAGAGTPLAVALLVAPQVFHARLRMALGSDIPAGTGRHVDEAFTTATLLSLGIAVVVATLAALTVAWLVSRRIAAPVTDLAVAAGRVATTPGYPTPGWGRSSRSSPKGSTRWPPGSPRPSGYGSGCSSISRTSFVPRSPPSKPHDPELPHPCPA
jgi:hypothetical protein